MLSIQNLNKTYANGICALRNISLEMRAGIFGLLGPNGAGKSSLMRTLATLQAADSGSVVLNGIDMLKDPLSARQQLGYLPQDFGVYPNVSAEELLNQLAVFKGFTRSKQRKEIVARQLALVNLYEQREQKLGTFSGGMRQRFGIAQALLGSPQLVIVDEPTAGLDPTERVRFQNILAEISQDRVLLLSTHIVEDVAELCPQMAILQKGQIVRQGRPLSLMSDLEGQVWVKQIDRRAVIDSHWQVITARMLRGQRSVRVWSKTCPANGFERVAPDLNDVYFTALLEPSAVTDCEATAAAAVRSI
ncbi:MAG: ABC transporter ATP-binding protein [Cyanobacteria bacterium J06621_11]